MNIEHCLVLNDMYLSWDVDNEGKSSWLIIPAQLKNKLVEPRKTIADTEDAPFILWKDITLREKLSPVELCRAGDVLSSNCGGTTLQFSSTTQALRYNDFIVKKDNKSTTAYMELKADDGIIVRQYIKHQNLDTAFKVWTEVCNMSDSIQKIDHVSSARLSGISPFVADDASEDLFLHRFLAGWSAEGRHLEQKLEDIELGRAWLPFGTRVERFGQIGSKPTQRWMPWVGIEHRSKGVLWAMHYEAISSWQAEVSRKDDAVNMSIGDGDRMFANKQIELAPGESFVTPAAWVTVCQGDIQDVSARLVACQKPDSPSPVDENLPIIFNEWCTTWGEPSHDNMISIADRLCETPCKYQVIDAGWYQPENGAGWSKAQGDWIPNSKLFPKGLKATCNAIRKRGLIPGIWFEFEVVGSEVRLFEKSELFLHRDGFPIQDGERRFLDLRLEKNRCYLEERMFSLIEECGIGYLKIDYNGNTGGDIDGPLSPGANLSEHMNQVVGIFKKLRERFPELVIENCASGGQRLTPVYGALSDMHSFSDVHTCVDIPVVAANVLSQIPAAQSQIWAVLSKEDSLKRLSYSLSATFLGRMCLSGEINQLSDEAWSFVKKGMSFYQQIVPIIKQGNSRRIGNWSANMRKLRGWQAVLRHNINGDTLVVVHCFEDSPEQIDILLPGTPVLCGSFGHSIPEYDISGKSLEIHTPEDWTAFSFLFKK